jgi:hypothetical protein
LSATPVGPQQEQQERARRRVIFVAEGKADHVFELDIPNRELGTKRLRSKAPAMRTGPFFAPASSTR